jgi:phospholipid transport system transporter-binding protein
LSATATWTLPASVDLDRATALLAELDRQQAAAGGGELHIDASAMQTFDTSLLALALEARRRMQAAGGRLVITGAPPKLIELAKLYGVDELVLK